MQIAVKINTRTFSSDLNEYIKIGWKIVLMTATNYNVFVILERNE